MFDMSVFKITTLTAMTHGVFINVHNITISGPQQQ